MEERKSQKKEIGKDAQQLLKEGTPKQQVFESLVDKYKYSKDVAEVLKNIPSFQRIQKYRRWNNLLLVSLITIELISLQSPSFGLLWYGLLIYAVAKKTVKYYSWITLLASLGFIISLLVFFLSPAPMALQTFIFLVIIFIPACILPIWLEKKLCPEPTERKEMYTNAGGEQRMRIVYEFNKN